MDAGRILYALCCEEACGLDHECGHEVEGVERVPRSGRQVEHRAAGQEVKGLAADPAAFDVGTRVIQDLLPQLLDGQLAASVAEVREKRAALAGGENFERQDAVAAGGGEDRVGTLEAGF